MGIIIGITGGIASGKSTVTNFLRQQGFQVVDADAASTNYRNLVVVYLRL